MTDDRLTRNLKMLALVLLSLALGAIVYLFLGRIKPIVVILIGATFFAYLIYPAVTSLQYRRFPRWAAIATVYAALALIIGSALAFAGPIVGDQARTLTAEFPTLVSETRDTIVNAHDNLLSAIPIEARQGAAAGLDDFVKQVQGAAGAIAGQALHLVAGAAALLAAAVLIPLLSFYILLDLDRLREMLIDMFPQRHRERTLLLLADIDTVLGGFVRGQLIVGAIVGGLVTLLLMVFHIKYALLIGVFAGVADLVPYVGAFAGAVPGVLLAIFEHGPVTALLLALGFLLMYELEGHIIAPAIVSQRVGLTPLMVIVAVLIGAELGGIGGMFLSVPIAGIIKVLWRRFMRPQVVVPAKPVTLETHEESAAAEETPATEAAPIITATH